MGSATAPAMAYGTLHYEGDSPLRTVHNAQ